jgi:hypothetical protein
MYLRTCRSFKFANHKMIWSANRKSAKCHICGRSANLTNYLSLKFAIFDLRNLFADCPSLTVTVAAYKTLRSFFTENKRLE